MAKKKAWIQSAGELLDPSPTGQVTCLAGKPTHPETRKDQIHTKKTDLSEPLQYSDKE